MKIAYIITLADQYGGAQIHVRDLSKWMLAHGHEVCVIGGARGIVSEAIENNNVAYHEAKGIVRNIHPIKDIIAFFQVRKILKSLQPAIVSCHSSKAGLIGRLAARSLGQKVIFTAHGWSFTEGISWKKRYVFRTLEWFTSFFSHHIITVSRYDKYLALKNRIAKSKAITVIHNGMPFSPRTQTQINTIPQLCMVARFSNQKDHTTLLNALSFLTHKDWHLNLIGGGDDSTAQALAIALGIDDRVTFLGQRKDVPDILEAQDIYLLISHWEGFPRSIIEAMRASLPVITTSTAGSPESVDQFTTGYVVPERNPQKLSRAINLLISDPIRCSTMGEMGRLRYEKFFTFDQMAYKTLNVYESVLGIEHSKQPEMQESYHP